MVFKFMKQCLCAVEIFIKAPREVVSHSVVTSGSPKLAGQVLIIHH